MTLKEIMKIRHPIFDPYGMDNGGIWFDMKDFWKITPSGKIKIEVVEEAKGENGQSS